MYFHLPRAALDECKLRRTPTAERKSKDKVITIFSLTRRKDNSTLNWKAGKKANVVEGDLNTILVDIRDFSKKY